MKRIGKVIVVAGIVTLCASVAKAQAENDMAMSGEMAYSNTSLNYNDTPKVDLDEMQAGGVAAQVVASSATLSNATFDDGRQSTFTLTVVSTQNVVGNKGSNTVTINANPGTSTMITLKVGSWPFRQSIEWNRGNTSSNTAVNFMNAVNASSNTIEVTASTPTTTTILLSCVNVGTYCNKAATTSNSSMTWTSASFASGTDPAVLTVGGVTLTGGTTDQGNYILVGANVTATAASLVTKLNTLLSGTASFSSIAGVVKGTSTYNGATIAYTTSRQDDLTIGPYTSSSTVTGAATGQSVSAVAPDYTLGSSIYVASHGYSTGLGVYLSTGSTTALSPLTWGATYYVIKVDADHVKLSTTSALAQSNWPVVLASSTTSTTAKTFTLNVPAIAGTPSYKWQSSIDGANWTDTVLNSTGTVVSSITLSAYTYGGASNYWDFGYPNYRYLRLNITAPTAGGMWIKVYYNIKRNR